MCSDKPSLIICHTHIGKGSPNKQDTAAAHGEPLGEDEVKLTKQALGLPLEPAFFVPDAVREIFLKASAVGDEMRRQWKAKFAAWQRAHPDLAAYWEAAYSHARSRRPGEPAAEFRAGKELATRRAPPARCCRC